MPIQFSEENGGKLLIVHVSGKLIETDYEDFVHAFERLIPLHGELRVLVDLTAFHGWDAGAAWEDVKFVTKHFADIERLALVGEKQWQPGMSAFGKAFTKAAVRYYDHIDADEARKWLDEADRFTAHDLRENGARRAGPGPLRY